MLRRPFRSSLVVQSSSSRPTAAPSCRSSHQRWYSPRAVFTAFCTSLQGRAQRVRLGAGGAPAAALSNELVKGTTPYIPLRIPPTWPPGDPNSCTPTVEPEPPGTLQRVPRHWLIGDRAPCALPHRCHSPSNYKKRVFKRHVSPPAAGGRAPSPSALVAGSLPAVKNAPPPPPRHVTHATIEKDRQGRKRGLGGRKCRTSARSVAILVVGKDGFLCACPTPSRLRTGLPSVVL